ncbi:MAG: tetratricopeptide repeat protein [Planctomycetales bacterium]|nr:tetratricopeptide repeat protein [Planctomycetales bacterium]
MHSEYRILQINRGQVLAQPLDGAKPVSLKIAGSSKYVENEIVVLNSPSDDVQGSARYEVIAARIDPSFIDGVAPTLVAVGDGDCEFTEYASFEQSEVFDETLEVFRMGGYDEAASQLRAFVRRYPFHIDSYHHLGIIETGLGHQNRALKYFETGYRIGLLSIPDNFVGRLPWICLENRPFLRAAHGYGLALEQKRRHLEAVEIYEQILSLNPNDNQGIRYLLPSLYIRAKAPQKARAALEQHGADGMNSYTRCLLEIEDGHRVEAIRWLCRGLAHNLHLPDVVLNPSKKLNSRSQLGVAVGSKEEAMEYIEDMSGWRRKQPKDFLKRAIDSTPIASRLARALELKSALDSREQLLPGDARSEAVNELFGIFDDACIPTILEECREAL